MNVLPVIKRIRGRWWSSTLLDLCILLLVGWGVFTWQSRHLLPDDGQTPPPPLTLSSLEGSPYQLANEQGKTVLLYFFAPWCRVCHFNIGNLETLRRIWSEEEVSIWVIALSWDHPDAVAAFARKHELTLPVLLGDEQTANHYQIRAFPTYYLINRNGQITGHSVGYATTLGIWWKTFWTRWWMG